ncbi:MAG: GAF domain-containing protein, partial [Pirellulaceae bacterium]|nr:GAF domain-containing protein [Pirellulaceae bacterium]
MLEFGRRERPGQRRVVVEDLSVSRDHLRVVERGPGRVLLECLSQKKPVELGSGQKLQPRESRELALPACLQIGQTQIELAQAEGPADTDSGSDSSLTEVGASPDPTATPRLNQLGESPAPLTLAGWFETLLHVQQSAAGSSEFFAETARAVVDLIGLDRGLVLLHQEGDWIVQAECGTRRPSSGFSRTVVENVLTRKQAILLTPQVDINSSLYDVQAVVAAPILSAANEVVGVVYGARGGLSRTGTTEVTPLEAQVVRLLAAIVSTGLGRLRKEVEAAESRARLEQFASPELARELARNPRLLEGAEREVTILFCDLRDFSRLSERLGAPTTYQLLSDVMDRLTDCVFAQLGVIVDYFGDGLCAMWNAPIDQPDHAERACQAALDMLRDLPNWNRRWQSVTGGPLHLGIGIHTGSTLVGNAGSRRRMKYGPRGHAMNLASRVEGLTKQVGVSVLVTDATRSRFSNAFPQRRLGRVRVAGIDETVELYELTADEAPDCQST